MCNTDEDCEGKANPLKKFGRGDDDMDNNIDEHYPDSTHAVADTWMEKALADKKRGKEFANAPEHVKQKALLDVEQDEVVEESIIKEKAHLLGGAEDYYHDELYEKTKSKKKVVLEDALKEVKMLKMKTKFLEKMINDKKNKKKKHLKKKNHSKHNLDGEREAMMDNYKKMNFLSSKKSTDFKKHKKIPKYSIRQYEGELFEKNDWNNLITSNDNELF